MNHDVNLSFNERKLCKDEKKKKSIIYILTCFVSSLPGVIYIFIIIIIIIYLFFFFNAVQYTVGSALFTRCLFINLSVWIKVRIAISFIIVFYHLVNSL